MRHTICTSIGLISLLLVLTGCDDRDPYNRTDVWRPTGANAGNLAAQVADPRDLIRGRNGGPTDAHTATTAVEHIWAGQPHPLAATGSSGSSSGGGSGSGGGAAAGGGSGS